MTDSTHELHLLLKRGPAILFLGQDYLRLETGTDSFLAEALRKYGEAALKLVDKTYPVDLTAGAVSALRERRYDPPIAGHVVAYYVGTVVEERLDRGESVQETIRISEEDIKSALAALAERKKPNYVEADEGTRAIEV